jgi:Rod binding domain-containing protein
MKTNDIPRHDAAVRAPKALDERSKLKLQKAAREFEAVLMGYMLKSMRSSMHSSELFGDNPGGDLLEGMFDGELARHVSMNGNLGLAEMLYRRITGEPMPHAVPRSSPAVSAPAPSPASGKGRRETSSPVIAPPVSAPAQRAGLREQAAVPDTVRRRLDTFAPFIQEAADTHKVSANLLKAVIAAESAGKPAARSSRDAKGLMQLIDSTAAEMGVRDVWNPRENILGGARYLQQLLEQFDGDLERALASYNAGPGAVKKHGGIPPFRETREYVERVMQSFRLFEQSEHTDGE